ncbi:hypothetical protein MBM_01119 [Drepanopeziza brunnea f. sp. 'multigermtubi' MB_m1]|uniref:Zn(2)-C6 fungal-type domain-containing protein n=1 Tax=Marssonina brunnea f. sp. multigermtubi (strain MB_m1) TaxID=1072389 RepID=K1X5N9_MARBU|nr:uncharacterized protein MBM_01119 [Drepanopeziza brunnea f. sp. 'multigermtubi' MB_m1]EKD20437.1 hypothetical protein MBM_01119 [Drepanopeziza brunnea f. sp. 'multigermtubi' MB_m1]
MSEQGKANSAFLRRCQKIKDTLGRDPTHWELMALRMLPLPPASQPYLVTPEGVKVNCPHQMREVLARCELMDDITGLNEIGSQLNVYVERDASPPIGDPSSYLAPISSSTYTASSSNPPFPFQRNAQRGEDAGHDGPAGPSKCTYPDPDDHNLIDLTTSPRRNPTGDPETGDRSSLIKSVRQPPMFNFSTPTRRNRVTEGIVATPTPTNSGRQPRKSSASKRVHTPQQIESESEISQPKRRASQSRKLSLSGVTTPVRPPTNRKSSATPRSYYDELLQVPNFQAGMGLQAQNQMIPTYNPYDPNPGCMTLQNNSLAYGDQSRAYPQPVMALNHGYNYPAQAVENSRGIDESMQAMNQQRQDEIRSQQEESENQESKPPYIPVYTPPRPEMTSAKTEPPHSIHAGLSGMMETPARPVMNSSYFGPQQSGRESSSSMMETPPRAALALANVGQRQFLHRNSPGTPNIMMSTNIPSQHSPFGGSLDMLKTPPEYILSSPLQTKSNQSSGRSRSSNRAVPVCDDCRKAKVYCDTSLGLSGGGCKRCRHTNRNCSLLATNTPRANQDPNLIQSIEGPQLQLGDLLPRPDSSAETVGYAAALKPSAPLYSADDDVVHARAQLIQKNTAKKLPRPPPHPSQLGQFVLQPLPRQQLQYGQSTASPGGYYHPAISSHPQSSAAALPPVPNMYQYQTVATNSGYQYTGLPPANFERNIRQFPTGNLRFGDSTGHPRTYPQPLPGNGPVNMSAFARRVPDPFRQMPMLHPGASSLPQSSGSPSPAPSHPSTTISRRQLVRSSAPTPELIPALGSFTEFFEHPEAEAKWRSDAVTATLADKSKPEETGDCAAAASSSPPPELPKAKAKAKGKAKAKAVRPFNEIADPVSPFYTEFFNDPEAEAKWRNDAVAAVLSQKDMPEKNAEDER